MGSEMCIRDSTPTPPEDLSSGAGTPGVSVVAGSAAPIVDDPDSRAPLFPPLPSLSSASSWGSMADLRDNELSPMEDFPSVPEVNVTDKKKTKPNDKEVPVIENTTSNESNERSESNESNERSESIESMESYESTESKQMKSDEIPNNKVESNEIELMDDASQSILTDKVIHRCEEGAPSVTPSSDSISVSASGSLVQKRSSADPSSEGAAQTKKVAKTSGRRARKPSSSTPSLKTTLPGTAKHVGLPSAVSAVPPRNRAR